MQECEHPPPPSVMMRAYFVPSLTLPAVLLNWWFYLVERKWEQGCLVKDARWAVKQEERNMVMFQTKSHSRTLLPTRGVTSCPGMMLQHHLHADSLSSNHLYFVSDSILKFIFVLHLISGAAPGLPSSVFAEGICKLPTAPHRGRAGIWSSRSSLCHEESAWDKAPLQDISHEWQQVNYMLDEARMLYVSDTSLGHRIISLLQI